MVKLVIFGLDGATFDIINPMINNGNLPTLKKITENGVSGYLESTFCPSTGPAWTSLATGKNPGKTGVFDFFNRFSENSYEMKSLSSANMKNAGTYWDILSDARFSVGVLNFPRLYPPYPINGFMVGGLGSSPDENITYPRDLKQKLINVCNGYKIHIPFQHKKYTLFPKLFVKDLNKLLNINKKSIDFLLNYKTDIFSVVISATDFAQHFMWKYIDKTHQLYNSNKSMKYRHFFNEFWKKVDELIGSTINSLDDDGNIIIVSDHGFGPHKQTFYLNNWLQKENFLFKQNQLLIYINKIISNLITQLNTSTNIKFVNIFLKSSINPTKYLDMNKTKAFSNLTSGGIGEIFLTNSKTSQINNIEFNESIKNIIINRLINICKNLNIKVDIYCPKDVYKGKYLNLVPDILFILNNLECEVSSRFKLINTIIAPAKINHSGTHRKNGIFLAYGKDIKKGIIINGAKIYDIAPTILHMFNLQIPIDMDGKVLKEIFKKDTEFFKKKIKYQSNATEKQLLKDKIRILKLNDKI